MDSIPLRKTEKKILKFLRDEHPLDYPAKSIAENVDIAVPTARDRIAFLLRINRIILTRTEGNMKFYTINKETDGGEVPEATDEDDS